MNDRKPRRYFHRNRDTTVARQDRRYVEGYRKKPESPAWAKNSAALLARVLPREKVNLDDISTIPKALVTERISSLTDERMREIAEAIRFALDLS